MKDHIQFPRINLYLVIQHVEPYKYINTYSSDYFDKLIPCPLCSFYSHSGYIQYFAFQCSSVKRAK